MKAAIHAALGPWTAAACCRFGIRSLLRIVASRLATGKRQQAARTPSKPTTLRDWLLPMLMKGQVRVG
jgi:hypothetical protein